MKILWEVIGMAELKELEMLQALRDFDTPSITNIVATYPANRLCLGLYNPWTENWYTDQTVRCMNPELGRTIGYAVTCVYGPPDSGGFQTALIHGHRRCARRFFEADDSRATAEISARTGEQGWAGG